MLSLSSVMKHYDIFLFLGLIISLFINIFKEKWNNN